jgi:hypothetical protein
MSRCSEQVLEGIKKHCASTDGGGPPECVKKCANPCTPECDKSDCPADVVPIIEKHCKNAGPDQTVITEPLPDQMQVEANIAKRIHDNLAKMETCDGKADCSDSVKQICKQLWENKMKDCIENAEKWAYHCPAPTYKDEHGVQRNCAYGCCSDVAQDVQEDCGGSMPPAKEVWDYVSGDDDKITRAEFEGGLTVLLPAELGDYVPKLADCLMTRYDVGADGPDGVVDETEFMEGFGQHLPKCMEKIVPKELLAKMATHKDCGEEGDQLEEMFKQVSGGDDEIIPADLAAVIGMQVPQFAKHAMPIAECVVKLVDGEVGDGDGAVQYNEFKAAAEKDMDIMTPCIQKHIPRDELANAAAHSEEHWCDYTDPEVEPCCKEQSHEDQDKCMDEKKHYCDFTGPDVEPCCAKQSRDDQDACLGEAKASLFSHKRDPHLLNKGVKFAISRFLHGKSLRTKAVKL